MEDRTILSSNSPTTLAPQIGALLRTAWEDLIAELLEGLEEAGFDDVRVAHRTLLRDVLTGRYRPSELAARVGLSKQAANDVLREFEAGGYITLVPDPDDGRAKRIQATERGAALEMTASRLSSDVARRWAEQVGEERFAEFEQVLREIVNPQGAPRR